MLEIIFFISIIVFNFLYKNSLLMNLSIIVLGIWFIIKYGFMKDNNYIKSSINKIVVSCLLSFFVTTYILGLVLGYNKTIYNLDFNFLFNILFLSIVTIIFEEIIRYIICKNSLNNNKPIIIYTIILCILNIIIGINGYDLSSGERIFIFISTIALPIIARESLCSYLTYKVGFAPSLIFKLVISTYGYIIPITPKLGNYLSSIFNIGLPFLIYFFSSRIINYNDKVKIYVKNSLRRVAYIPIFAFLIILVILVSGIFSNTIIAIGSNSMKPIYERGDAIIYEKTEVSKLKKGEVIAFRKGNIIITHRIIDLMETDNRYTFKTKGDANNAPDDFIVDDSKVLGKVKYAVKYVGYPTLWLNEVFNKTKGD